MSVEYYEGRTCACGCGGLIEKRASHKYNGIPKYIKSHWLKDDRNKIIISVRTGVDNNKWKGGVTKDRKYQNKRQREYSKNNPEMMKAIRRKGYLKNKDKILKSTKEYKLNNPEWVKAYQKKHYIENKNKHKEYVKKWRKDNPEIFKEQRKKYRDNNKDKLSKSQAKSRSKQINDMGFTAMIRRLGLKLKEIKMEDRVVLAKQYKEWQTKNEIIRKETKKWKRLTTEQLKEF